MSSISACVGNAAWSAATLTHHIEAQRSVRDLRANIDGARHGFEPVEVFGNDFQSNLTPLREHSAGDVLHALHQT